MGGCECECVHACEYVCECVSECVRECVVRVRHLVSQTLGDQLACLVDCDLQQVPDDLVHVTAMKPHLDRTGQDKTGQEEKI